MEHRVQGSRYPERRRTGIKTAPREAKVDENPFIVSLLGQRVGPVHGRAESTPRSIPKFGAIVQSVRCFLSASYRCNIFCCSAFAQDIEKAAKKDSVAAETVAAKLLRRFFRPRLHSSRLEASSSYPCDGTRPEKLPPRKKTANERMGSFVLKLQHV